MANPRSFRLTERDLDLLQLLEDRTGRAKRDVIGLALTHLWETMRRDEKVYLRAEGLEDVRRDGTLFEGEEGRS
ncbi:MAG: hypothetical protein J2P45_05885 [Candidatus Dormibacteraeota bacterium]|nr:hypothetical protein [Candidatus Dormibacteraeota bacterium]